MTPEVATRFALHENEAVRELAPLRHWPVVAADRAAAAPVTGLSSVNPDSGGSPALLWREALVRRLLAVGDITSAALAVVLVLSWFGQRQVALSGLAAGGLILFVFKVAGLYDRDDLRLVHSTLDEVPLLAQLTGLFALNVAILDRIGLGGSLGPDQIGGLWIASFGAIVSGRVIARAVASRTAPPERCLVIGEAGQVSRIREKLAASHAHAQVIASLPLTGEDGRDYDWVSRPVTIRRAVRELNLHRIIIAPTATDTRGVVDLIRMAKAMGVRVSVLPRMFEVVGSAVEFDDIDGMTMLGVRRFGLSHSSWLLKRAFDLVVASIALVAVGPLLTAIAIAIRIDTDGPTFFRQVRVGRDGKHFQIFKFRSMVVDADAQKEALRASNEGGEGLFKLTDDPRVTRVGRFLRRTSLDELPQLLNVLQGNMSLVGPRPLVIDEDAQVLGLDRSRLYLTPGMTGPWQVLGSRVPMQEMVGIDYLYVANWTLWLDLKVLLRTVLHVARRGNL
jgi:exopolysaccharide biosynthesis polyprenyl glycosylphosphotransferase